MVAALVILAALVASFVFIGLLEWARIDWPRMFGDVPEDEDR